MNFHRYLRERRLCFYACLVFVHFHISLRADFLNGAGRSHPPNAGVTTCFRAQSVTCESNSERELAQVESTVCFQRKLSSERA